MHAGGAVTLRTIRGGQALSSRRIAGLLGKNGCGDRQEEQRLHAIERTDKGALPSTRQHLQLGAPAWEADDVGRIRRCRTGFPKVWLSTAKRLWRADDD
jgi:hypothetical protein